MNETLTEAIERIISDDTDETYAECALRVMDAVDHYALRGAGTEIVSLRRVADVLYELLRKADWCPGCDGGCSECRRLPAMPWRCGSSESALREGQDSKVPKSESAPVASPVSAAPTSGCELVDCKDPTPHTHQGRCEHPNPGDGSCENCRCAAAVPTKKEEPSYG